MKKVFFSLLILCFCLPVFGQQQSDNAITNKLIFEKELLNKLIKLNLHKYGQNKANFKESNKSNKNYFGFSIDSLEKVFPELITVKRVNKMFGKNVYRIEKIKTIDESRLIMVLAASIKAQHHEIEDIKKKVLQLAETGK